MEFFDKVISLGQDCGVAGALRNLKYKDASYPFDWNVTLLDFIIEFFDSEFINFKSIFNNYKAGENKKVKNKESTIFFYHDADFDKLDKNFFANKYNRRITRLDNLLNSKQKILFVRKGQHDTIDKTIHLRNVIRKRYPGLIFKILLINNIHEESDDECIIHVYKPIDCFLKYEHGMYRHSDSKLAYNCVYEEVKKFNSTTFKQPKYRDNNN